MPKKPSKRADQYDDDYNYLNYWQGRDYEHAAEEMAIRRLLGKRHFKAAADIGGGYGRLCVLLEEYADKVTLVEPAKSQHEIAREYLKEHPRIYQKIMQADDLKFKDNTLDLLTMIRVMHHLPNPLPELKEAYRVLEKDGLFILEVANYAHGRNRAKYFIRGKKLPVDPIDIRSAENRGADKIAFVNHNPQTVIKQISSAGFNVEKVLSVSNLRSQSLKKIIPRGIMISIERLMQPTLARIYFGPSIFFLLRKP